MKTIIKFCRSVTANNLSSMGLKAFWKYRSSVSDGARNVASGRRALLGKCCQHHCRSNHSNSTVQHISTIVHRLSTAPLWPAHIAFIESGRLISKRQEYTARRAHTHRIRKRNTDSRNSMNLHRITAARWMSDVAGPHIAIATLIHLNPSISAASSFALIDSHVLALAH